MSDSTPQAAADQEVLITRIFEAPRERVHIDLRVGGRYELTMVKREGGAEFSIGYEILELVEPELIVLRSDPMPQRACTSPPSCAWSSTTTATRPG